MCDDTTVKVRDIALPDLPQVAALHKRQFGDHFLGKYSPVVLQGFYRSLLAGEVFLVAERDGKIVGYVSGGDARTLQQCRRRFLLRNLPLIAMEIALRPHIWGEAAGRAAAVLGRARHHGGFTSRAQFRLLAIAVSEFAKGSGVAASLLEGFETRVPAGTVYGLSVHDSNARAIAFYAKQGFVEEGRRAGSVFYVSRGRS